MLLRSGERSVEWVSRLPAVVAALNNEQTRLGGLRPKDAIKAKTVAQKTLLLEDLLVSMSKNFPLVLVFAISMRLASLKVVFLELLIQFGPLGCIGLDSR